MSTPFITVVGAGFSGTLLSLHLKTSGCHRPPSKRQPGFAKLHV
jgi:hypothetical protein